MSGDDEVYSCRNLRWVQWRWTRRRETQGIGLEDLMGKEFYSFILYPYISYRHVWVSGVCTRIFLLCQIGSSLRLYLVARWQPDAPAMYSLYRKLSQKLLKSAPMGRPHHLLSLNHHWGLVVCDLEGCTQIKARILNWRNRNVHLEIIGSLSKHFWDSCGRDAGDTKISNAMSSQLNREVIKHCFSVR